MAYQIDRYNNTLLTVVEDGTVDQTTDLKFIGKNYAGYGEIQNENFLFLLENFAGANQPARPLSGQVWFDSGNSKLKFYDGEQWRTTGGAEIGTDEPTGLAAGDFWWDSANDQLYVYNGTSFILIGPQNAGEGVTQMQSLEVLDTTGATRGIIAATIEDETVFVVSPNEFELNATTPIAGFDKIRKGMTLKWTRLADAGVTNSTDVTGNDFFYWGTASNADKLGGVAAAEFIQKSDLTFDSSVEFPDAGILVGDNQDFQLIVENGSEGVIQNVTGQNSIIKVKVTDGAGTLTHVATFNSTGLIPATDNTFDIGTSSLRWKDMYAVNFVGTATKAATLQVGANFRSASVSATNDSVAVRDATGNLAANLFQGTATQARYADLAEKYTTGEELVPGTVVTVCAHEDHEVEAASRGTIAIGVVSTDPAVMMNSEADGQYIGLKGRLPVRIIGAVAKGDAVYVDDNGCASTAINGGSIVGVALESNSDEGEKLVECVLKV
jgi:hypothetical protein